MLFTNNQASNENRGIRHSAVFFFLTVVFAIVTLSLSSCNDEEEIKPIEFGTVTDIQGNGYRTVKIGSQWWMAENLRTTQYRNGDTIVFYNQDEDSLWNTDNPAYAIHPDATEKMGFLYNWSAIVNPAGLAPEGWHIPTDDEWKALEASLGMEVSTRDRTGWRGSKEGDALKERGVENWFRFDPVWATNSSGFSALSGSCRLFNGDFGTPGRTYTGFWWTATSNSGDPSKAWYRYLDYKSSKVFRQYFSKRYGCSVRCVKD